MGWRAVAAVHNARTENCRQSHKDYLEQVNSTTSPLLALLASTLIFSGPTLTQVAIEFGIEGGLDNFKIQLQDKANPLILGMTSSSERTQGEEEAIQHTIAVQGTAACIRATSVECNFDYKITSTVAELRQEIMDNWRNINVVVIDMTVEDFDGWEALNLIATHRRDYVRTLPVLVILSSEDSVPSRYR